MFVSDWMTKTIYTLGPENSVSEAIYLLKEKKIKHLPITNKDQRLLGILSDRDIKEYTPSKATSLDIHELHFVLFKTKISTIMKKKVLTTTPDMPVEEAAMIMYDNNIGCLPVVEHGRLVGIISDRDLFHVLIDITGVRYGGRRFCLAIPDELGATKEVIDVVRTCGFIIESVLTTYEGVEKGFKRVVVRTKGTEGDFEEAQRLFQERYGLGFSPL